MFKQPVQQWESIIDGTRYDFLVEQEKAFTYTVTVDSGTEREETTTVKGGPVSMMFGFDEAFTLGNKSMRLVAARSGMDIAYDGRYLITDRPYIARPAWVWVFVALCISLVLMGSLIGGIIGFIGSAACLAVSRSDSPAFMRIGVCVFITILTWASTLALIINIQGISFYG